MLNSYFPRDQHTLVAGYLYWLFGFTGSHRFYFGKPITGTIWFLSFGLFGIGWIVDLFLIPSMEKEAEINYISGQYSYNISWLLLTFFGYLGLHRFYLGKYFTGIIWLVTGGLLTFGWLYDYWKINQMVSELNSKPSN